MIWVRIGHGDSGGWFAAAVETWHSQPCFGPLIFLRFGVFHVSRQIRPWTDSWAPRLALNPQLYLSHIFLGSTKLHFSGVEPSGDVCSTGSLVAENINLCVCVGEGGRVLQSCCGHWLLFPGFGLWGEHHWTRFIKFDTLVTGMLAGTDCSFPGLGSSRQYSSGCSQPGRTSTRAPEQGGSTRAEYQTGDLPPSLTMAYLTLHKWSIS